MSISTSQNKVSFYMQPEDEQRARRAAKLVRATVRGRESSLSHFYSHAISTYVNELEALYNDGAPFPDPADSSARPIHDRVRAEDGQGWPSRPIPSPSVRRFVPLEHIQDVLSISRSQAYALVRTGDLRAIRVGGRAQWRIELTELEAYIERAYQEADAAIADEES